LNQARSQKLKKTGSTARLLAFPVVILIIYGFLFAVTPEKAALALRNSRGIFVSVLIPLFTVFVIMLLLNLFLKPAQVARFLGKGSGIKSALLSAVAGIISTGPIYAWYPLLKDLKRQGAANSPIAIFLYNRAVKPFLLPVMIGYFGWEYVVILTICMVLGSFVIGYAIETFVSD
jgi:uncharacterized membrane protein YraQ (UPF0718 family)